MTNGEETAADVDSLLNEAACKRALIRAARDGRYYWQQFEPRVSSETLAMLQRVVRSAILNHCSKLPSKGKTL